MSNSQGQIAWTKEKEGAHRDGWDLRCNKELVLDIYEMFRELDRCKKGSRIDS